MNYRYIIFLLVALFSVSELFAQADQIEIQGCSNIDNNGIYTSSGFTRNGAPCYLSEKDPFLSLELSANGWVFGEYLAPWIPCNDTDGAFATNQYSSESNTDVTQVTSDGATCGSATSIIAVPTVPTMSQWGVLIVFFLLMIFGVLSLKEFSGKKRLII